MIPGSSPGDAQQDFVPLSALLRPVAPKGVERVRKRLAGYGRESLIEGFRKTFATGKRLLAHLMAEELVKRGIPPCCWHERLDWNGASVSLRYDLFMGDLLWLRCWHRGHAHVIRYSRYQTMLIGLDAAFHREAEYAFWAGRRPMWKLVASLSLTESQQWECAWLRSTPVRTRAAQIEVESPRALDLLRDDLDSVRRTVTFGEAEAEVTLRRRHAIWRSWRIEGTTSPTAIAARYEQLTGEEISRQLVANHLGKIQSVLKGKEMKSR